MSDVQQRVLSRKLDVEERAAMLHDQWRLARVETANWGTFSGLQILPVDRRGMLITGPSGSGKSSLLDAITTVLTPPMNRRLNAAAMSGGSKGDDRTICSYIRGAWRHETDETGEVSNSYLRPRAATWSGILLRYETGHSSNPEKNSDQAGQRFEPVNLLVLYNLKANSNSNEGLGTLYAVVRGEHCLKEFEPYAVDGVDFSKFNRNYKDSAKSYRDHSSFTSHFCRIMGISSSKTLVLLHKTQAAKNFGSLDDLFRKFMLDEPDTYNQVETAIEQFSALDQAYEGVVDQRKQMQHLEPLVTLDADCVKANAQVERLERQEGSLKGFTGRLVVELLETQKHDLQKQVDHLVETVHDASNEQQRSRTAFDQAQTSMNDAGGVTLTSAQLDIYNNQQQLENIQQNRKTLAADLDFVGVHELPKTYSQWTEFSRMITVKAADAENQQATSRDANYAAFGQVTELKKQLDATIKELRHLRTQATNIPSNFHRVRLNIASHLGVSVAELPFVGELISVKEGSESWQGAIERLLGQYAKTLLVSSRHARAVAEYLEDTHLGLRFEYEAIPAEVEVPKRSIPVDSLIKKLTIRLCKSNPEFTDWINKDIREHFNFVCVDTPTELTRHQYALSLGGQIKRKGRYVKDDRHSLNDRKRWILGNINDEKIETLSQEEHRLSKEIEQASKAAEDISKQAQVAQNLLRLSKVLLEADWKSYDEKTAQENLLASQKHYDVLKEGNQELSRVAILFEEARTRKDAADEALRKAELEAERKIAALKDVEKEIGEYRDQWNTNDELSSEDKKHLSELFKKIDPLYKKSTSSIYSTSSEAQSTLNAQKIKTKERIQKIQSDCERIFHDFRQKWPLVAMDLSENFADKDQYLAIYRRIKVSGLPEYEQRFMKVLNDFSQDQITVLASTIRDAFRMVKERLIAVNASLGLSEYAPGRHLQIETRDNRSKQVTDFLRELKAITEGILEEDNLKSAEARYIRTARVIKRLRSDEYADRKWRGECLDTRQHVSFIAKEIDGEGNIQGVHSSDAGLSGGQKQKLVIFCLAAALRYQLADEDQPIPSYGTVILDEAFDKADHNFTATAMGIFEAFGFHMVLATPLKLLQTLEKYIGAVASVHCEDSQRSSFQLVSIEENDSPGGESLKTNDNNE